MATSTHQHIPVSQRVQNFCRAAGVTSGRDAARIHAEQVLKQYGKTTLPIDARELCVLRGIQVEKSDLPDCAARILPIRGGYVAQVNTDDRSTRQSFSLCHELGHTLFDVASISDAQCPEGMCSEDGFEEYLCDVVASELLMPTEAFTNVLEGRTAGWSEAWKIANTFGVSFHAAVGRIQKLDLWPCVLVIVQPIGERGTHPQFKLDTYYSSESLGRDAIGVGVLAGKVVDFLNARGDEVLTTGHSYELDSRLPTSLSIQGQYFKIADNQLGRVLVFKTPRPGSSKEASKTFKTALMSTRLEQLQLEEL